jgi:carbon-monoxide dehydrogenase medium subunit
MNLHEYHRPISLAEALRLKADHPDARFIAGATDLMVRIRAGVDQPRALISLRNIPELVGVELGETTRIGALTTISAILAHRGLGETASVLIEAARPFASMQIRNMATVGGNLCNASPAADLPPALLVLDARVCLASAEGSREVPLDEFFQGPGQTCLSPDEVVTSVVFDAPSPAARTAFRRQSRVAMDLALVSIAVSLVLEGERCVRARVAAGAVAPRPLRLRQVEAALEGQRVGAEVFAHARAVAEKEISPISDLRASAAYRRRMTGTLFQRAVESIGASSER